MSMRLKKITALAVLSGTLLASVPVLAAEGPQPAVQAAAALQAYRLNDQLQVQIVGLLNEQNSSGVKLGAAVRIINTGDDNVRIPDHVLQLKADDGTVYTLQPSAANVRGIQGQSKVVLTYLKQLNRTKPLHIKSVSLVDINYDVYPKVETPLVDISAGGNVWKGSNSVLADLASLKEWGERFTLPALDSPLQYTPVSLSKSFTNQGAVYLVRLLVDNPTDSAETVPSFQIDGKTKTGTYAGSLVESGTLTIEPGNKTYIHFSISTPNDAVLDSLNLLLLESFYMPDATGQAKLSSTFGLGKLSIAVPGPSDTSYGAAYKYGVPIAFEPYNDFINPDMRVALVEMHASESVENGYKNVIAKLRLENTGDSAIPVPNLQAELAGPGGASYLGSRQSSTISGVQPGTGAIISYAFVMPDSQTGETFSLKLQGTVKGDSGSTPHRSTIATLPVRLQTNSDRTALHVYPFTLNLKSWTLVPLFQNLSSYSYKIHLDMDVVREPTVMLDGSFSKLKFELVDSMGRTIGTQSFPFTGANRIVSGTQWLNFTGVSTDQAQSKLMVRVSESIMTENGEMNRILTELQP